MTTHFYFHAANLQMFTLILYKRPILSRPTSCTEVIQAHTIEYILCSRAKYLWFFEFRFFMRLEIHIVIVWTMTLRNLLGWRKRFSVESWGSICLLLCSSFGSRISICVRAIRRTSARLVQENIWKVTKNCPRQPSPISVQKDSPCFSV
jgi:hypothetical protein